MSVGTEDQELQSINGEFFTNGWMADLQIGIHAAQTQKTDALPLS